MYWTSPSMVAASSLSLKGSISAPSFLAPFSIAPLIWASVLLFCHAAVVKSAIFPFLPVSVSALPSAPWQEAHFAFQVRTIFLSASAWAEKARIKPSSTAFVKKRMVSILLAKAYTCIQVVQRMCLLPIPEARCQAGVARGKSPHEGTNAPDESAHQGQTAPPRPG